MTYYVYSHNPFKYDPDNDFDFIVEYDENYSYVTMVDPEYLHPETVIHLVEMESDASPQMIKMYIKHAVKIKAKHMLLRFNLPMIDKPIRNKIMWHRARLIYETAMTRITEMPAGEDRGTEYCKLNTSIRKSMQLWLGWSTNICCPCSIHDKEFNKCP